MNIDWKKVNIIGAIATAVIFKYLPYKLQVILPLLLGIYIIILSITQKQNKSIIEISIYLLSGICSILAFLAAFFTKYFISNELLICLIFIGLLMIVAILILCTTRDYQIKDISEFRKSRNSTIILILMIIVLIFLLLSH